MSRLRVSAKPTTRRALPWRMGAWGYLGAVLVLGLLAELWVHSGRGQDGDGADDGDSIDSVSLYARHAQQVIREPTPLRMAYPALSAQMDEAALRTHFVGLPLVCSPVPASTGATAGGDVECLAEPAQVDGVPALQLRLRLKQGLLTEATVRVPWWRHHVALRGLLRDLGAAQAISPEGEPDPSIRWRVAGGEVRLNRVPGFDPLRASRIVWQASPVPTVNPVTKSP